MNDITEDQYNDDFGPFVGLFWATVFFAAMGSAFTLGFYWHTLFAY